MIRRFRDVRPRRARWFEPPWQQTTPAVFVPQVVRQARVPARNATVLRAQSRAAFAIPPAVTPVPPAVSAPPAFITGRRASSVAMTHRPGRMLQVPAPGAAATGRLKGARYGAPRLSWSFGPATTA